MGLKRQEIEKPLNNVDFDSFPSLLTIKQVSEIFKVHPNTLRNWDRSGRLKAVRIGPRKDRRYEKSTVQKLYKELYSKGEIEIESQPDSNEVKPTDEGKYILQPGFSFHKVRLYFISRRFSLLVYSAILVGFAFFSIQSIFFAYVYTIRAEEQPLEKYYVTIKPNKVMGWNGQNLAKDISLLSTSKLEEFNEKNSAVYVNEPVTPKKTEAILNVSDGEESIVTTDEEGDNPFVLGEETDTATETITDPADKASETDSILVAEGWQLPGSIPAEALLKNVKVIYSFAADSFDGNEDVMTLEYSLDAGQNWYNLDSFSLFKDISNATNGGFWEFPLEDLTKDSINDFRTRVTYNAVPGDQASTAYLDGVIMEVELEEPNPVNIEIQESVGVEEHDVTTDEEPVIEVEVKEEAFFSFLGAEPKERIVKDVKLVDPDGEKIDVEYEVRSVKDGNTTTAEYAINTDDFDKPGLYRATIVVEQDGIIEIVEQDFTWGVMAINPDQSIYQTGQEALFSIGILDDHGDMVCDADVVLTITNPDRSVETRTTKDGSIVISENCRHKGDFRGPDYYADYLPSVPGTYTLNLRATHQNGMRTIDDSFEAQLSPTYTIKRYGPTRVFPYIYQPMSLTVMAYENFEGEIVEVVPDYFEIETVDDAVIRQVPQGDKTVTEIVWNRTLAEGQSIELIYNFKTPEESPALYLVGPAKIGNNWDEGRQWQMAIDVTYMYLLANTASAASGWTDDTATFDSDFVRGAATFSSTGGGNATHANTVHHNVVSAASADYGGTTCSRRCALVAATDHTHSNTNPTISNANNDPAHYTYYIWKNDTGVPSTIPDNIFAFFDSNPGGSWTQFSAANDRMVKIDNSHTTGGSDTHTH
ncbi:helix-turn-helix domain-containing protein, partial [Patescibacteria group bacterium]|nr:helix-turn-helix domain-containing protein [Patescibacteria group bacterium]